jgi:hypothetical protein
VSTVLDVALCLLLVGVAVGTLTSAIPSGGDAMTVDSDPVAHAIATETAAIPSGETEVAHATLAEHLAQAVVLSARMDGERLTGSSYPASVRRTVEERTGNRVHVTARWEPYADASLGSEIEVGPAPPPTADTAATSVTVDSGMRSSTRTDSFEAIAASIAEAYVDRLFPPERTRLRLVDPRTAPVTNDRYQRTAGTIGTSVEWAIDEASPSEANERLAARLASRIETDLRAEYGTAESVPVEGVGEVEIVVRRWEP